MRGTSLIGADELKSWPASAEVARGRWALARPLGMGGFWHRLRLAWGVFTGRYDALRWERQ